MGPRKAGNRAAEWEINVVERQEAVLCGGIWEPGDKGETCPYVHSSKHISHILNQVEKINKHSTIKKHDTPTIHKRDKNKFLLCSKGKYIQYFVIKYNGKECEVENIYAYIYI